MKKLMIAAALVAAMIGSASADCNDPCGPKCLFGYKIQLVARTTIGGVVSNAYAKTCDSCFRKPTMGKVVGYIFGTTKADESSTCGDGCGCNDWNSSIEQGVILLWKAWNKKALPTHGINIDRMDRIGYKDRSTVESVMTIKLADIEDGVVTGDLPELVLAGFGKAAHQDNGNVAVKNLSGFFAGRMLSYCEGETGPCGDKGATEAAQYWLLCGTDDNAPDGTQISNDPLTAAYGKWQMVWDPQLVARLTKQGVNSNTARPSVAYEPQNFEWDHQ